MTRRKLVKQGPSTLTVSLPAEWVRAHRLQPGQEVLIEQHDGSIVVHAESQEAPPMRAVIDMRRFSERMLKHTLHALHKRGFDEVVVTCTAKQSVAIKGTLAASLLGFEIVEQKSDTLVLRSVMRMDPEELPMLIRRAFLVTLSLAESLTKAADIEAAKNLEETNNRLTNYCERLIMRGHHSDQRAMFWYIIVWLLEKIADEYKAIAATDYDLSQAERVHALFKEMYHLYYRYSFEEHNDHIGRLEEAEEELSHSPFLPVVRLLKQTVGSLIALSLEAHPDETP